MIELKKSEWKQVRNVYETTNISMKDLAAKFGIKYGTLKVHKNRNKWQRTIQPSKKVTKNVTNVTPKSNEVTDKVTVTELDKSGLTPKRQKFCLLYLKYYNATKAYHEAFGAKMNTSSVEGCRLLNNPKINAELTKLRHHQINQLHIDRSNVLKKLVKMYFANIGDYIKFGNQTAEDINTGEKYKRSYVYFKNQDDVDTDPVAEIHIGKDGSEVKLPDKTKIAKLLLKYLPAPINNNVKSDTLISALEDGLKKKK